MDYEKVRDRYGLKRFGSEPKVYPGECYLISEVVKGSEILEFPVCGETPQGGLFFKFEGKRIATGFAPPIPCVLTHHQPFDCFHAPIDGYMWKLWILFKKASVFNDYVGNTVLPGMRLADIIAIGMITSDQNFGAEKIHIDPISVKVDLWEMTHTNAVYPRPLSPRLSNLMEKQFTENSLGYNYGSFGHELRLSLYDCEIPHVGPTFCTTEFARSYQIILSFRFVTSSGKQHVAGATIPITIAKDYCNCLGRGQNVK